MKKDDSYKYFISKIVVHVSSHSGFLEADDSKVDNAVFWHFDGCSGPECGSGCSDNDKSNTVEVIDKAVDASTLKTIAKKV